MASGERTFEPFSLSNVPCEAPAVGNECREAVGGRVEAAGLEECVVDDHDPFHAAARVLQGEPVGRPVEAVVGDRDVAAEVGFDGVEKDRVAAVEKEIAGGADVVGGADDFELPEPRLEPAALDRDLGDGPMGVALQDDACRPRAEGAAAEADRRGSRAVGAWSEPDVHPVFGPGIFIDLAEGDILEQETGRFPVDLEAELLDA